MSERRSLLLGAGAAMPGAALTGCATTRRTIDLVVEHHVGMVRQAADVLTGAAQEREQRLSGLLERLERDRQTLEAESDPGMLARRLREHVALQDAILAELMSGGHHGGGAADGRGEHEAGGHHERASGEISAPGGKASIGADER